MTSTNETFAGKHKWVGPAGTLLLTAPIVAQAFLWLGTFIASHDDDRTEFSIFRSSYDEADSPLERFFEAIASVYSQLATQVIAPHLLLAVGGVALLAVAARQNTALLGRGGVLALIYGIFGIVGNMISLAYSFFFDVDSFGGSDNNFGDRIMLASWPSMGLLVASAFVFVGVNMLDAAKQAPATTAAVVPPPPPPPAPPTTPTASW